VEGRVNSLDLEVESLSELVRRGETDVAMARCHRLLRQEPHAQEVLHCLALCHLQKGRIDEASQYLKQALQWGAESADVLNSLGIVHLRGHNHREAARSFRRAVDIDPSHQGALGNLANLCAAAREPGQAEPYLERLIQLRPFDGEVFEQAGRNALAQNNLDKAIEYARAAVRLRPHDANARLTLADALEALGTFRQATYQYLAILERDPCDARALARVLSDRSSAPSEQQLRQARELVKSPGLAARNRAQLHLGLARYQDRSGEYASAYEYLVSAGEILSALQNFRPAAFTRAVDRLITTFSSEILAGTAEASDDGPKPIFIVGMPRSGTTLVEQILSSHPVVAGGGELSTIVGLAMQLGGSKDRYPEIVPTLTGGQLAAMRAAYRQKLRGVSSNAAWVTDKMPINFLHLGLIQLLFPDARIIHCRRDPLDTCLSCLFTSFSEDLRLPVKMMDLGQYYLDYTRLMTHWNRISRTSIQTVDYERLVGETDPEVRRLLDYCELPWHPDCLSFFRTQRSVRTPSRWQVRQPVYRHSVGRWRHYETQLQGLAALLAHSSAAESG